MSTPPTTPSTVGCNSPDVFFATTVVSARAVSPNTAFKFLTREAPQEPDFLEPSMYSEPVNQMITGMMPSPKNLFQVKTAEREEDVQHALDERFAACDAEAPAKEESSKPRKVVFGNADDVRVFSRTTEVRKHMLEVLPIGSLPFTDDDCSTDVEVSLRSASDKEYESFSHTGSCATSETGVSMGKPEEATVNWDLAKFRRPADEDDFAMSKAKKKGDKNSVVDRGEFCVDSQTRHSAVVALNKSGRKVEALPCRFIHLDDCSDHQTDSESEISEAKGTKSVHSYNIVSDFIAEPWKEEEKSRGTNSTDSKSCSEDVKHLLSDIRATFANVGSQLGLGELSQRLSCYGANCSDSKYNRHRRKPPFPNSEECTMEISWLSKTHDDIGSTISRLDSLSDYGSSTQDSRAFSLDITAIPKINSMCTLESSKSSKNTNKYKREQRGEF